MAGRLRKLVVTGWSIIGTVRTTIAVLRRFGVIRMYRPGKLQRTKKGSEGMFAGDLCEL
jgi:hypothetical protein